MCQFFLLSLSVSIAVKQHVIAFVSSLHALLLINWFLFLLINLLLRAHLLFVSFNNYDDDDDQHSDCSYNNKNCNHNPCM